MFIPRYLKTPLVFLAACMLLFGGQSCKKKSDAVSLPITGTWQPVGDTTYKYIVFDSKNSVTVLIAAAYGIHTSSSSSYTADEEQITFAAPGNSTALYNYKVSNDSLYLTNVNSYIVLTRNNTVTATGWSKTLTRLESHALGNGLWFGALDWDGSSFIISSAFAHKMFKVSASSFSIIDSVPVTQKGSGIAISGGSIWLTNYGVDQQLHTIDYATGTSTFNSANCAATPMMLGADNSNIWVFTNTSDMYLYDTGLNSFALKQSMHALNLTGSGIPPDMVVKDGYAYVCAGTVIFKLNLSTYLVEDTWVDYSGDANVGIAYDGSNFYTITINLSLGLSNLNIHLNKVQLQ